MIGGPIFEIYSLEAQSLNVESGKWVHRSLRDPLKLGQSPRFCKTESKQNGGDKVHRENVNTKNLCKKSFFSRIILKA